METLAYACFNKNLNVRNDSSSGGIYTLLAESILKNKGVVFAACYNQNFDVEHKLISTVEELADSRGAKYVVSHLGDTFRLVKEYLDKTRKVLFVGTPCQCVGLLSYLNKSYEDLFCVDFVCHGVPSRIAWQSYLTSLNRKPSDIVSVNMRDKSTGWKVYSFRITYKDGTYLIEPRNKNLYIKGFLANLYLRPSCYECNFKGIRRKTDITLGDFWGADTIFPKINDNKGMSLAIIHSLKGREILNEISSDIVLTEAKIQDIEKFNPCISDSTECNLKREQFFIRIINNEKFNVVLSDLTKVPILTKVVNRGKSIIKKIK